MRRLSLSSLCAVLVLAALSVSAEPAGGTGTGRGPGAGAPPSDAKREQVRKKVEAVRMWRMTEELKLDDKTSGQLASFLSSIEDKRRGLLRTTMESRRDLRYLLSADKPDQGRLKSALDRIEKNQQELVDLSEKERKGIKSMLTVEQQARYVIFQHDFRAEMRGMIAGARGDRPGQGGPGQGHGTGMGPGPGGKQP